MAGFQKDKAVLVTVFALGLFMAGRFLGMGPLSSVWSLAHWSVMPPWQIATLVIALAAIASVFLKLAATESTGQTYIVFLAVPLLVALFYLFRFDSFALGGGNLRVAQIGQVAKVAYRWFEFGAVAGVAMIYNWLRAADMPTVDAAATAWTARGVLAGMMSAIGAAVLATLLSTSAVRRMLLFVVTLFGGHALMYFGYIGVEVVIPPIIIWYAVAAVYYTAKPSGQRLLYCWLVTIGGPIFLFPLIILLPATIYLSLHHAGRKKPSHAPIVAALLSLAVIVAVVYWKAGQSLELASQIILFSGKKPFVDYGLFSPRHMADWIQIVLLGAPTILIAGYLLLARRAGQKQNPAIPALAIASAGGVLATLILDPMHSIVLDAPRFLAYLTPVGALLAIQIANRDKSTEADSRLLPIAALTSVAVLLSILPVYRAIALADQYASPYLDSHNEYYVVSSHSFRDAYFQRHEFDNARRWESSLPAKSPDYFLLRGSDNLRMAGNFVAAAEEQHKIVTKYPYWTEPRAMLAVNYMSLGRYLMAKSQIDTCLMLEPYKKGHHVNLYSYYRDVQNWPMAIEAVNRAAEIAPGDVDIQTDRMIIFYRANDLLAADVMADELLAKDSLLPFPYLIKGFLQDRDQKPAQAVEFYERFLKLAPTEPESPKIQERVTVLKAATAQY